MPPELKAAKNKKAKLEKSIENMDFELPDLSKFQEPKEANVSQKVEEKEEKRPTFSLSISLTNKLKTAPEIEEKERDPERKSDRVSRSEKEGKSTKYDERKKN